MSTEESTVAAAVAGIITGTEMVAVTTTLERFDRVAAGLALLKERHANVVFDVATPKGMDDAKAARMEVREPRYEIEHARKAAKGELAALGRKVDSEAAHITAELLDLETPIHNQIKAEEDRREAEKEARRLAEEKRVQDIKDRIDEIRGVVAAASTCTAVEILEHIGDIERIVVDATFAEFQQQAEDAHFASLARLRVLHAGAVQREEEAAKIERERAELEQLRAAARARDEEDRQRREAAERKEREEREAREASERREREQREIAEREKRDAEHARQQAELKAERDRLAEEDRVAREARQAEKARLDKERQELEAREAAVRKAETVAPPAPAPAPAQVQGGVRRVRRPEPQEIIDAVAARFEVFPTTAQKWLMTMNFSVPQERTQRATA